LGRFVGYGDSVGIWGRIGRFDQPEFQKQNNIEEDDADYDPEQQPAAGLRFVCIT
jgi:hypothetical protein